MGVVWYRRWYDNTAGFTRRHYDAVLHSVSSKEDVDRLFSYYTKQQVAFLDWQLGATFWAIQVFMMVVVFGYVLIWKEGYLQAEQAKGAVVTHVAGDAVAISTGKSATRYFSTEELTYPGLENGNVFLATRQTIHRQMRGYCEDPNMPCSTDADCSAHGKGVCAAAGVCRVYSWCSVETEPEIYEMDVGSAQIWMRSFIQFVKLAPDDMYTNDFNTSEPNGANTFSVRELLGMVAPLPVHYEEASALGGIFEVGIRWNCRIGSKKLCRPEIDVRRIDTLFDPDNIGYGFSHAEYIDDDHRLQNVVSGIRFMFRTTGVGKRISWSVLITTVSTASTLMSLAIVVADLLLTKVFKNRKKYIARKFEQTPDFSEYIQAVEIQKQGATKLIDIEQAEQQVVDKEDLWLKRFLEHA